MSALQQALVTVIIFAIGYLVACLPMPERVRNKTAVFWFSVLAVACLVGVLTKGTQ